MKYITVVCGSYCVEDKYLVQRRGPKQHYAGKLEFPGGKMEVTDPHVADALLREWQEELDVTIHGGEIRAAMFNVKIDDFRMDIFMLNISNIEGELKIKEDQTELLWLTPDELSLRDDLCPTMYGLVERLKLPNKDVTYTGTGKFE